MPGNNRRGWPVQRDMRPSAAEITCLVLMYKAPKRSKQRLAATGCDSAAEIAGALLDCALEDLRAWPGPICLAPASEDDRRFLVGTDKLPDSVATASRPLIWAEQGEGNLGTRIHSVSGQLAEAGHARQIFIGIDCPGLSIDILRTAADCLTNTDAVLVPAFDGGVVLMGANSPWPALEGLPWSQPELGTALLEACLADGGQCITLEPRHDLDEQSDLSVVLDEIAADRRPARRVLRRVLTDALSAIAVPSAADR